MLAATSKGTSSGSFAQCAAEAQTSSARPPQPRNMRSAQTRSPTARRATSGPVDSTTPATSDPRMETFGRSGAASRMYAGLARRNSTSEAFSEVAWIRTRTSPSPGTGSGTSRSSITSGSP